MAHSSVKTILFDGSPESWSTWRVQMRSHLGILGYSKVIQPDEPDTDYADWKEHNTRVYMYLVSACQGVSQEIILDVPEDEGRTAWLALNKRYNSKAEARLTALRERLMALALPQSDDIDIRAHVQALRTARRLLKDAGATYEDDQLLCLLKSSLPPRMMPLRMALAAKRHGA